MNLELTDFVPFGHSQCDNMWKWCTMEAAAECCGDLRGEASSGKSMYGNGLTFAPLAFTGFVELRTVLKRNVSALQDALLGLL